MKKEPIYNDKDFKRIAKGLTVLSKKGVITAAIAAFIAIGGGAGAATYFGIKASQANSQYTLVVKDNAVGHWVGDKIDLNDLDISKVDNDGKVSAVDKSKVTLSKDTLDKEGENTIFITDAESKAKSELKVSVLGKGKITSDMYNEMYDTLNCSSKIFKYNSCKIKREFYFNTDLQDITIFSYKNGKEQYNYTVPNASEETSRLYHTNNKLYVVKPGPYDNPEKDKTLYCDGDQASLFLYDELFKETIVSRLIFDFSFVDYNETRESYIGNKEIYLSTEGFKNFICEYKFNNNLLSKVIAKCDELNWMDIFTFEYNKLTEDPFVDPVNKNFNAIDFNVEGSGHNRSITLSATLDGETVENPNLGSAQCYATSQAEKVTIDKVSTNPIKFNLVFDQSVSGLFPIKVECLGCSVEKSITI